MIKVTNRSFNRIQNELALALVTPGAFLKVCKIEEKKNLILNELTGHETAKKIITTYYMDKLASFDMTQTNNGGERSFSINLVFESGVILGLEDNDSLTHKIEVISEIKPPF